MKRARLLLLPYVILALISCVNRQKPEIKLPLRKKVDFSEINIPVDKGFSEYIEGYTSGIISVNSPIEVRFTPEFAAKAMNKLPAALFLFEPAVKGKAEWKDDRTVIFKPNKLLDPGKVYTCNVNLYKLEDVKEQFRVFSIKIGTIRKDFVVTTDILESNDDGSRYSLHGELTASDYILSNEVESYLEAKLGRKRQTIIWDHSGRNIHKFTVTGLARAAKPQRAEVDWDGTPSGVKQKGRITINIPPAGEFSVIDVLVGRGAGKSIDIVFSDPLDPTQEIEGLVWFKPAKKITTSINANILTLHFVTEPEGVAELNVEPSIKNKSGRQPGSAFSKKIDFSPVLPAVELTGEGVIIPASKNLILPFRTANLKSVDLKIIKIFENNLPWFLQENDLNAGYTVKRFGRPVYSGKVDLVSPSGSTPGTWNLHTVDLSDYIDVEPGILYKVELSMRPSYSLYPCTGTEDQSNYEEYLRLSEEKSKDFWDDPEVYYDDSDDFLYYSYGFNWKDRNNPCKPAYYSPDRKASRNIIASNFGIIAKRSPDNSLVVEVNDLLTALPLSEVTITAFDYQLQEIASGNTNQDGSVRIACDRKPFLLIARKDKDRNYLKITEGSSLSMSSFDVSGVKPENGIKAFIYGERDVWRPGDSIYLSVFIKDMKNKIPADHPVQFELINPLEQRVDYQVKKPDTRNLMIFRTSTSPDAVTGNYKANIRIGGALFTKRVRVEAIKPNRLKIDLTFPGNMLEAGNLPANGSLKVSWLNSAVAGNLRSTVEYLFKASKTEFPKYPGYDFDDPAIQFYAETVKMFDGSVDENGNAAVVFNPGKELKAPGMLNAVFTARVSEKGGDESITQTVRRYAPYTVFTGISFPGLKAKDRMLFTDRDNEIKLVTLSPEGEPVNSDVEISIYRISYRWWWEADQENLAEFISNDVYKPVATGKIRTINGEGSFTFRINRNDWGRYYVRATSGSGHSTGRIVLIDWPWEYGMKGKTDGATLLAVSTDREKYSPGDDIKLSFPAPENSRAIITLENSTSVLEEIRASTTRENTVVTFKAKPEMAPGVYAYVTVIQPHAQTLNDMPMRLYGVIPVSVEDPQTHLEPVISMPSEIRSQKSFDVKVSEANRKPMTYTLAVVDEGLLGITAFKTPDPWNYFYAREALGIQTWDLYDMVLGAFGGTLDRALAVGGDETVIDRSANKAQRFVPVVKFLGPFSLGQGKSRTHSITLPQYTGSVRTMVIAGNEKAFGAAEKTVIVKDPLMILVTAPRVISPGEKAALPVTLFIQKEGIRNIDVIAEPDNLVSIDEKVKSIPVSGPGEKNLEFMLTSGEKTGISRIRVTASGGGETAVYDLALNIRSPNPPEIRSEMKLLGKGEKWESSFGPFGIEGSNSASLEVSTLPSVSPEKNLDYLMNYPHGCTEQVVSSAFPQLWMTNLVGKGAKELQSSEANIKEGISKVVSRQMAGGGIALWPGSLQPDNWVTSYAGHFMIEAERNGYNIPSGFMRKWVDFQQKAALEWRYDQKFRQTAYDQAYRLLTLALAGVPDRGAMNRLRESEGIPQVSKWLLSAAFAVSGRPEVAGDLLDMRNTQPEPEYEGNYYGSDLRDKAIILYTLSILKNYQEALPVLKEICDEMNSENWYSTQSLAWGLFSYMKFIEMVPGGAESGAKVNIDFNGEGSAQEIEPEKVFTKALELKTGSNRLVVENQSDKPVYITLVRKGIPLSSDKSRVNSGLSMTADYLNTDLKAVDPASLQQGEDFMMVVKVTNNGFMRVENIALTQMVPSGWEIRNTRMFETGYGIKESSSDYRDFRDDRVNTYFSLNSGETRTFVLVLNAAYKGEFYQPSVWCEAMYTRNFYCSLPGRRVAVTGQKIE